MVAGRYGAEDIEVLEGLEPVRKRPGMFIAGTDTPAGLHQLVFEILDNSVDEAMNGHADSIEVTLHVDGESVTVKDNGRGIPVDNHPIHKRPALELILTTLHAGGKFSNKNYSTAGGLHGVGSSVVNALSEELVATVRRDGKEFEQRFSRGRAKSALKVVNKSVKGTGTTIFFRPDTEIFPSIKFSATILRDTIRNRAYLNPGLRIVFIDETTKSRDEFLFPEGIRSYLHHLIEERKAKVVGDEPFFIEKRSDKGDDIEVAIAVTWTESTREEFVTFANGIHTPEGGSHEQGAKSGFVKAIRNYIEVHNISLKGVKIGAEDIREGLLCLVSVKLPSSRYQAQFQGQTKSKLNNPEVAPLVEAVARTLEQLLNEKPSTASAIVNRIILAAKARAASRAAGQEVRRKVGVSHRLTLPGKLADCSSSRPDQCELFIVEGDSAGGSAKQGRDRATQAVLPLRGKVLNTVASNIKRVLENKELSNIVSALGCGSGDGCKSEKLRYGKVIILTDADADGMHIATLLLAFFFQHMRALVDGGCIYLGKPPLYGVFPQERKKKDGAETKASEGKSAASKKKGAKKDKPTVYWAYSDEELAQVMKRHNLRSPKIVRYKGLGEMNPDTLWDTTLDPETRTLLRVTAEDEDAVVEAFNQLMGSDPSARYRLICEQAAGLEIDI